MGYEELDARKMSILKAIIDDYIASVEPVGSRTIAKKYDMGLSSATIRNEMADLEELGYILYDVQYVKEGQNYFLRIFIEKEDGTIDLNDCEKVNDGINDLLDTADYIKEQYFLEVSSTGVEKVLRKDKHLKDNIGNEVEIKLFKPINKQKEFIGILEDFSEDEITLKLENDENINIDRKDISLIKTTFNWDEI